MDSTRNRRFIYAPQYAFQIAQRESPIESKHGFQNQYTVGCRLDIPAFQYLYYFFIHWFLDVIVHWCRVCLGRLRCDSQHRDWVSYVCCRHRPGGFHWFGSHSSCGCLRHILALCLVETIMVTLAALCEHGTLLLPMNKIHFSCFYFLLLFLFPDVH